MKLKNLLFKDKLLFNKFLHARNHGLSTYSFENIYVWKPLYEISWTIIQDNLCVFFKDSTASFMYLPPLGENISLQAVQESFALMDYWNTSNKTISRIENIEEADKHVFCNAGYRLEEKFPEYICDRMEVARFRGNRFKSQRSSFNYFAKNYSCEYLPFSLRYRDACIGLYKDWMRSKKKLSQDPVYNGMMVDSFRVLDFMFTCWGRLDIIGRVVKIGGKIKAFSLGFALNKDIFCIAYEVTDLSIKGLSQFIFSSFCKDLAGYKYINIMDDSGLENIKRTKLLYHPARLTNAFIASRKDE